MQTRPPPTLLDNFPLSPTTAANTSQNARQLLRPQTPTTNTQQQALSLSTAFAASNFSSSSSAEDAADNKWVDDLTYYEQTLEEMATVATDNNFKDELTAIDQWFRVLSEPEQTAAVYNLLQHSSPPQIRFFITVLQNLAKKDTAQLKDDGKTSGSPIKPQDQEAYQKLLSALGPAGNAARTARRLYDRHTAPMGVSSASNPSEFSTVGDVPIQSPAVGDSAAARTRFAATTGGSGSSTTAAVDRSNMPPFYRSKPTPTSSEPQESSSIFSANWGFSNIGGGSRNGASTPTNTGPGTAPSTPGAIGDRNPGGRPRSAADADLLAGWSSYGAVGSGLASPMERPKSAMGGAMHSLASSGWGGIAMSPSLQTFAEGGHGIERPKSAADADISALAAHYHSTSTSNGPLMVGIPMTAGSRPAFSAESRRRQMAAPLSAGGLRPTPLNLNLNLYPSEAEASESSRDRHLSAIFHPSGIKSATTTTFVRSFDNTDNGNHPFYSETPTSASARGFISPLHSPLPSPGLAGNNTGGYFGRSNNSRPSSPSVPPGLYPMASPVWPVSPSSARGAYVVTPKSKLAHEESDYTSDASEASAVGHGGRPKNSKGTNRVLNGTPKEKKTTDQDGSDIELLKSDIPSWLRSLRLHKYTPVFEGMAWTELIHLNDEELTKKGVAALGARRKMLKVFENVRKLSGSEVKPTAA